MMATRERDLGEIDGLEVEGVGECEWDSPA